MKVCTQCKENKDDDRYYSQKNKCKDCINKYQKEKYKKRRENQRMLNSHDKACQTDEIHDDKLDLLIALVAQIQIDIMRK